MPGAAGAGPSRRSEEHQGPLCCPPVHPKPASCRAGPPGNGLPAERSDRGPGTLWCCRPRLLETGGPRHPWLQSAPPAAACRGCALRAAAPPAPCSAWPAEAPSSGQACKRPGRAENLLDGELELLGALSQRVQVELGVVGQLRVMASVGGGWQMRVMAGAGGGGSAKDTYPGLPPRPWQSGRLQDASLGSGVAPAVEQGPGCS